MNKEETSKIKFKLPLITDEDIRVLDNNFGYITSEVIKSQTQAREFELLRLIIQKQQQALIDIREYINSGKFSSQFDNLANEGNVSIHIEQIIDKVLGE